MDLIPPEILLHIFEYVDGPAPSEMRLHDEPSLDLLVTRPGCAGGASLKAASLVSRSWRSLVLPYLFRHVLWKPAVYSLSAFTLNPIPLLKFLTHNQLTRHVLTFTMIIDFHDPATVGYLSRPQIRAVDLEWLWDHLFTVLDPLRFTILARPTTLAALLSRMLYLDDAWSFDIPYHILSVARSHRQVPTNGSLGNGQCSVPPSQAQSSSTWESAPVGAASNTPVTSPILRQASTFRPRASRAVPPCPLFTVRPWTSILLNEGSSTKVYRMYEFYLRRPPSILGALLGCEEHPNDTPLIPQTIVDFNYIAIFPLASHFEILVQNLPRVDRLFVQLIPKSGSGILEDVDEMKHIDPGDLWMERNTSYNSVMQELISTTDRQPNWSLLRVFESGDAYADRDAWESAVLILENSEMQDWRAKREGVFVRHVNDEALSWDDEVNGHVGGFANFSKPESLDH
ncbi:hypothetical protein GGR51DRAFT_529050 [Nemania sp. FL0031]|nr:hypothetical protein GGR51DRAFT_529050 [Nemania sp. FL0031]